MGPQILIKIVFKVCIMYYICDKCVRDTYHKTHQFASIFNHVALIHVKLSMKFVIMITSIFRV